MKSIRTIRRNSGRAALATLAAVGALILGCCLTFARGARAQDPTTVKPVRFMPIGMAYYDPPNVYPDGPRTMEINLMLPDVHNAAEPFQVQLLLPDGSVMQFPIPPAARSLASYTIYPTYNYQTLEYTLTAYGPGYPDGKVYTFKNKNTDNHVAVSILPATRANGNQARPESAGIELHCVGDNSLQAGGTSTILVTPMAD